MKNKKGMQLAVSTIVLLVLGVIILIGFIMILIMGWDDFKIQIGAILGSDVSRAQKACKIQCELENSYDYCCEDKEVNGDVLSCQDDLLSGSCSLDCSGVNCGGEIPPMP